MLCKPQPAELSWKNEMRCNTHKHILSNREKNPMQFTQTVINWLNCRVTFMRCKIGVCYISSDVNNTIIEINVVEQVTFIETGEGPEFDHWCVKWNNEKAQLPIIQYYNMTVWHFGPCVTFWPCLCDISDRLVWHFGPLVRNEGKRVSPYPHINHWCRL